MSAFGGRQGRWLPVAAEVSNAKPGWRTEGGKNVIYNYGVTMIGEKYGVPVKV